MDHLTDTHNKQIIFSAVTNLLRSAAHFEQHPLRRFALPRMLSPRDVLY